MTEQQNLPAKIESIVEKINKYVPSMQTGRDRAVAKLQERYDSLAAAVKDYDGSPNDDLEALAEATTGTLSACKKAYDLWNSQRMEITGPLDEFKKEIMEYEKAVSDKEKDNLYAKNRNLLVAIENKKLAYKTQQEAIAKRKKDLENHKVDLTTQVRKNLSQMLIDRVKQADSGSRDFWNATTLETFEDRSKNFLSAKIRLKQETYDACFNIQANTAIITPDEYVAWKEGIKTEETYDIWNERVIEAITPTINEWRAKIPKIKEDLIAVANAKDEAERERLKTEQAAAQAEETKNVDAALAQASEEAKKDIESEATMSKMQNEFVEQATVQTIETAPTKKKYVVKDEKMLAKALCNAIYHAMINENFPGIYKLDKKKQRVLDEETGAFLLKDEIQWWFDFVANNCDVSIEGMDLVKVAKITIRK
jgi:hypothetical protein